MTYATQQIDVVRTIIAPTAAALHWLDFMKAAFPKAQHVLRQIEFVRHLTDGAKCIWRLVVQSDPLPGFDTNAVTRNAVTAYADSAPPLLIRCFRIADGLNTITRRGEIGTSLPVLGLRPIRWP